MDQTTAAQLKTEIFWMIKITEIWKRTGEQITEMDLLFSEGSQQSARGVQRHCAHTHTTPTKGNSYF